MSQAATPWCPRVTVACIVNAGERYLMVEEEVAGRVVYNQPAGHLEEGESLVQAAARETLEETGWTVAVRHLVGIYRWRSHEHGEVVLRFAFAAQALHHDAARPLDVGIRRALWLDRRQIAALGDERLRSPLVLASIDAWLAGRRLPLDVLEDLSDVTPCA